MPAAEKLVSAVLRDYHAEPEVLRKIEQNYPKTKNITLAEQSHISINWSAASVYTTGFSKVHAKGFNSMGGSVPEPEPCYNLWPRALGSLFVHESALDSSQRDATRGHYLFRAHLGGSADGYDWTRTSGVTVPKLTLEESKAVGVAGLGSTRIDAEDGTSQHYSGSVTFGETDRLLGQFGNLAILITPATTKRLLGRFVGDFQGEKTYHFIDDQVICLGSKYKAGAG